LGCYRVKEWFYHLGFVYLGLAYASKSYTVDPLKMIAGILAASLYLAGGYSYNRFCDSGDTKRIFLSLVMLGVFILWSVYLVKTAAVFFLVAIVLNILYVHPGYLWKKYHLFSVLLNGYTFGLLFLFGALVISLEFNPGVCALTIFFMLVMFPYQILHEIAHFLEDNRGYNNRKFKVYLRQIYCLLFILLAYTFFIYNFLEMSVLFILVSYLFIFFFFICIKGIDKKEALNIISAQKIRSILRYAGIAYGLLLIPSFV